MAPNPKVASAFRAMRVLGISEEIVKPVLKNLLKLYDKNWELIEEESYRVLADAIFEFEETKEAELKKKSNNIDQEEDLEEEAQVHDEPERPLKRLRLRHQEGHVSPSLGNSNPRLGGTSSRKSKVDGAEVPEICYQQQSQDITEPPQLNVGNLRADSQAVSPQPHLRNKGKQPVSPKPLALQERSDLSQPCATDRTHPYVTKRTESDSLSPHIRLREKGKEPLSAQIPPREKRLFSERSSHALCFKEPKIEPGIVLLPKKKVPDSHTLIKPKDEPFTDDMAQFEVPIAAIPPAFTDPLCQGDSSIGNNSAGKPDALDPPVSQCADGEDKGDNVTTSSNERTTNYELANIPEDSPPNLEIASSPLGEVKISLSCNSAIGRPDFHTPSLDAVLKLVEDKCLRSYRIIDPNFSVMKLMRDMCESFLELGTESTDESQERSLDVTPTVDSLNKSSTAGDASGARGDRENCSMQSSPLNSPVSVEVLVPEILRLPPSVNGLDDHIHPEKKTVGNGCSENEGEKELKDPNYEKSHSLVVVQQCHLTPEDIRSLYDVNDISKGEERVKIPFVNEINIDHPPTFRYIPQNLVFQNACVNFSLARIGDEDCCSTCFGDCLSSSIPCACARETGAEFAYTLDGVVKEEFLEECISMNRDPQQHRQFYCKECPLERSKNDEILEPCKGHLVRKFIKECWSKCGCSKRCGNRLVQRGITCNLQVFLTPDGKGWGLRTLEDLPKGAFVCEYVGEILTSTELYYRNTRSTNNTYPVLLDANWGSEKVLKDEEALCLDATCYGNVARFINHRCLDANLVEIPVEVETPDHHYYHLAFFTTRKVDALEELTWDYGIDFDDQDHPVKAFRCQCGSKFCRNMKRSNRSRSAAVG